MKTRNGTFKALFVAACMLCLILDSRYVVGNVQKSIELCLKSVIPGLFPMFVLSGLLVSMLMGMRSGILLPLGRFCGIPAGCESLFLLGILGGFPNGAVCIRQAVEQRALSPRDAARILGFCNNCGPAFLFGIVAGQLEDPLAAPALFLIQLETALTAAALWPGIPSEGTEPAGKALSLPQAVTKAIYAMVQVCGWVILAGVLTGFLERWVFPFLSTPLQIGIQGVLELTGGCVALGRLPNDGQRLVLAAGLVCFGGICVLLQIQSVSGDLPMGQCICQKTIQGLLGMALAVLYLRFGFSGLIFPIPAVILLKKAVEKGGSLVYNSPSKGGISHAVSQKN